MPTYKDIASTLESAVLESKTYKELESKIETVIQRLESEPEPVPVPAQLATEATSNTSTPSFEDLPDNHPLKSPSAVRASQGGGVDNEVAHAPGSPLHPDERQEDGSPRDDSHIA